MELNQILKTAIFAGKMVLENGGETYRTEDTITEICYVYGAHSECFATLTGIFTYAYTEDKNNSMTMRIKKRTVDLEKVHQVNDLLKHIKDYTPSELLVALREIDKIPRYSFSINLISHGIIAASFGILFGSSIPDYPATFLIGVAIYLLSYSFSKYELNGIFVNTLGGALSAFLAHFFLKYGFLKNFDAAIIGSLMSLVPGLAITNGIRDIIAGDYMTGMARSTEAILIAICLAAGTGATIVLLGGGF
ncbi:MAG: threonine/serine exporter family protein [Psychrilyobacter sp.]|nr:threonine/serine exporter family protein [Psychrilyobacter sp.]